MPERERIVITGDYARVNLYPVRREARGKRGKRNRETPLVQRKLNQVNRERMLADLLHLNFTEEDYFIRLSYEVQPDTLEEAEAEIKNYFRRVRYLRKKRGLSELKYIYFTECGTVSGRVHHHMFINDGISRDELEDLWRDKHPAHGYANSRRLQFNENGLIGLSKYGAKASRQKLRNDGAGEKAARTWNSSKNLKRPQLGREIFKNDYRIRVKDAAYIDENPDDFRFIEELYPEYFVVSVEPTSKSFLSSEDETPLPKAHFITIHLCLKDAARMRRRGSRKRE